MKKITISYENGEMIFKLGEDKYCMDQAQATLLFGNHIAHNFRESFDEWNQDVNFIARFDVAKTHFFGDIEKVAKFLKLDELKLRRWIGQGGQKKLETEMRMSLDGYGTLKAKIETELFPPEPEQKGKKSKPSFPTSMKQIRTAAQMVMQKMPPREIAKALKVPYGEYIDWISTKTGGAEIEKTIRQLSGSGEPDTVSHIRDRGIKSTLEETKPL